MEMADLFVQQVARWHDFYILSGTAAATLMGLLFVALSLHLDAMTHDGKTHLSVVARDAFVSFMIVLFLSLVLLTPEIARRPLGVALAVMGILRLAMLIPGLRHSLADDRRNPAFSRSYVLIRLIIPVGAYLTLLLAGVTLLRGNGRDGLAELMSACVLLIADGTRSAWDLMVRVGRLLRVGSNPG